MSAIFRAKDGSVTTLMSRVGLQIKDLLRANGIPENSVIVIKNGTIVSEFNAHYAETDRIEINHVRPYDLNVTRSPPTRLFPTDDPFYTKVVTFEQDGEIELIAEQYGRAAYPTFTENTFVESVTSRSLFQPDQPLVVGLSAGRDSVAFLTLLSRTRHRLPRFNIIPVTVTGLPDWEEPATFAAAVDAAAALGTEHVCVDAEEVQALFQLKMPLVNVLDEILARTSGSQVMMITHHVMRRAIETVASRYDVDHIVLGLNADDLLATLVSWFLNGYPWGPFLNGRSGRSNICFHCFG
jgi:sulfur carrier protein ThiS